MPLLGQSASLLAFAIADGSVDEHDDCHPHEHMPERLGVPGFLRGSRWKAVRGEPAYLVLYEVAHLDVLTSAPYLQRLNAPTPWTTRMMPAYRNMTRGLCVVRASHGPGLGGQALLIRLRLPGSGTSEAKPLHELLGELALRRGISSAHWLEGAVQAPMTREQSIRGADRSVDSALLVTAYEETALDALEAGELAVAVPARGPDVAPTGRLAGAPIGRLAGLGAEGATAARYRLCHTLHALGAA